MSKQYHSALYTGQVQHLRFQPIEHSFAYRLSMFYLDLDEIDDLFKESLIWSTQRWALMQFKREDYLQPTKLSLKQAVYKRISEETGQEPQGRVRILTHPRYIGYVFNPVSFYYVFDQTDTVLEYIVADITNTPWGERYSYVLHPGIDSGQGKVRRYQLEKQFHVSPFIDMDQSYDWRFTQPGERLSVHLINNKNGAQFFTATMNLQRRDLDELTLIGTFFKFPLMTFQVISGIYFQALKLWLKGAKYHKPPEYFIKRK